MAVRIPGINIDEYYQQLGPIEPLIRDDRVTEVMVNGIDHVYVEMAGKVVLTNIKFQDEDQLLNVIQFIVRSVGRRIDERVPLADARLADGSRVNAVIRPLAIDGPLLTIRKFAKDPNGEGEISIQRLVINSLRMRPERIVVGECRGAEALDMLQAMNTGHDGSMTTIHANSPRDALARLETLVLMAGVDLPVKAIRQQVAGAINIFVQLNRLRDGSRRVTSITEVNGMEGDTITMQDIFVFESQGAGSDGKIIGDFVPTGLRPKILDRMFSMGLPLPQEILTLFPERQTAWQS